MRILASSLFIVLFCFSAKSQFYERKNRPLMDLNGNYSMNGWLLSPGLTYMWPNKISWLGGQKRADTVARGRIGLYLEIGRYHIFPEGGAFFNYMDYSISYKRLSGSEEVDTQKSLFKKIIFQPILTSTTFTRLVIDIFYRTVLELMQIFSFGKTEHQYQLTQKNYFFPFITK